MTVLTRRNFLALLGAGALTALAGPISLPVSVGPFGLKVSDWWNAYAAYPAFQKGVYGYLYAPGGKWNATEPASVVIPAIINAGAKYCLAGDRGSPNSTTAGTAKQLISAGVQLGVRYSPFNGTDYTNPFPLSTVQQQTSALLASGFYSYLFLDHALQRPDVQAVVNTIKAAGWVLIATNETGGSATSPTGVWLHEKGFNVMNGTYMQKIQANPSGITSVDIKWIASVRLHDPGSTPVLKLENPSEVLTFASLTLSLQTQLLTAWSKNESTYGYRTFYPMFAPNYDSIVAGTYKTQASLLQTYG